MDMKKQMKNKNFIEFGKDLGAILEELLVGKNVEVENHLTLLELDNENKTS